MRRLVMALTAFALNCSFKSARSQEQSSTDVLLRQVLEELQRHDVPGEIVRAVDHNIKPGVSRRPIAVSPFRPTV